MSKYYDVDKIVTHNSVYNFIITNRGSGKTYGFKKFLIKKFLKNGTQWIYVRRWKTETKKTSKKYFDKIKREFPDVEFSVKGDTGYINGKPCCYFVSLSTSLSLKSDEFPFVDYIIYDEFIINKKSNVNRYINDEVTMFNELFETVAREKPNVRAYFLGNNVNIFNPYFVYFNLPLTLKNGIQKYNNNYILVDGTVKDEFVEEKKKLPFYKMLEGTRYYDYALNNESLMGNDSFIALEKPHKRQFLFSIFRNGKNFGVWLCDNNIYYVDDKIIKTSKLQYTLTKEDFTENYSAYELLKKSNLYYSFKQHYYNGLVRYKDLKIKNEFMDILNIIGI